MIIYFIKPRRSVLAAECILQVSKKLLCIHKPHQSAITPLLAVRIKEQNGRWSEQVEMIEQGPVFGIVGGVNEIPAQIYWIKAPTSNDRLQYEPAVRSSPV